MPGPPALRCTCRQRIVPPTIVERPASATEPAFGGGRQRERHDATDGHHEPDRPDRREGLRMPVAGPMDHAICDGSQMTCGKGMPVARFTSSVAMMGHELAHGVQCFNRRLPKMCKPGIPAR